MMRSLRFLTAFTLLSTLLAAPSPAAWHSLPAGKPYITSFATDSSGNRMFLFAEYSGFWRSTNSGTDWLPSNSNLYPDSALQHDRLTALDAAADTLLVHSWAGWAHSFDAGASWTHFDAPDFRGQGQIAVWRGHPNIWLYSCQNLLSQSTDYGQSWTTISDSLPASGTLYQDPARDSTLFLIGNGYPDSVDIHRSTDLGRSWIPALSIRRQLQRGEGTYDLIRLSNGTLVTNVSAFRGEGMSGSFLVSSTDDGQTWQEQPNPAGATVISCPLEDPAHPGRLFASADCMGGLLRSDDYGQTWRDGLAGLPAVLISIWVKRNPFSGDLYAYSREFGSYKSRDHGDTWQAIPLPPVGDPDRIISITEQAVFATTPPYGSPSLGTELQAPFTAWRDLGFPRIHEDSTLIIGSVFYKNGDTLLACAATVETHCMARSEDNGLSWQLGSPQAEMPSVGNIDVYRNHTFTRLVGWYCCPFSLRLSEDRGQTWRTAALPDTDIWADIVVGQNDSILYVLNSDGIYHEFEIYRTADLGATWQNLSLPNGEYSNITVLGDEVFTIDYSRQQVMHWSQGAWDVRGRISAWKMIGIPGTAPRLIASDDVSTALWISEDLGFTWTRRNYDVPFGNQGIAPFNFVYDEYRQRLWATAGIGTVYLDLAELNSPAPLHFLPADYTVLSAYPNPFNPSTRIRFDLVQPGHVKVDVFDIQGRLVQTLVNGVQEGGKHEVLFDGSALASGTYFVRLQSQSATQTKKLLLLK